MPQSIKLTFEGMNFKNGYLLLSYEWLMYFRKTERRESPTTIQLSVNTKTVAEIGKGKPNLPQPNCLNFYVHFNAYIVLSLFNIAEMTFFFNFSFNLRRQRHTEREEDREGGDTTQLLEMIKLLKL